MHEKRSRACLHCGLDRWTDGPKGRQTQEHATKQPPQSHQRKTTKKTNDTTPDTKTRNITHTKTPQPEPIPEPRQQNTKKNPKPETTICCIMLDINDGSRGIGPRSDHAQSNQNGNAETTQHYHHVNAKATLIKLTIKQQR